MVYTSYDEIDHLKVGMEAYAFGCRKNVNYHNAFYYSKYLVPYKGIITGDGYGYKYFTPVNENGALGSSVGIHVYYYADTYEEAAKVATDIFNRRVEELEQEISLIKSKIIQLNT